jgi:hypothetical protein
MALAQTLRWLRGAWKTMWQGQRRLLRPVPPGGRRVRLALESLEDRFAPAIYTVVTNTDTGFGLLLNGDLRYCLTNAVSGDTIQFAIGTIGTTQTITLNAALGALPTITQAITIDGSTQGGAGGAGQAWVGIDGTSAGGAADGLTIETNGVTVRGLALYNFGDSGIVLNNPAGAGNQIQSCYIGTDTSGTSTNTGNTFGIVVNGAANTIGGTTANTGNVISGNSQSGVVMRGTAGNTGVRNLVARNTIGLDVLGRALPNLNGVVMGAGANGNTIGGPMATSGNVISGNRSDGVLLSSANQTVVQGNWIGVDFDDSLAGNLENGVEVIGNATGNTIGGDSTTTLNVICDNGNDGVRIAGTSAISNKVAGNYIGIPEAGDYIEPNVNYGVEINASSLNTIGGTSANEGNKISGNGVGGVLITDTAAVKNQILGNYIGTDASGSYASGNTGDGVDINGGSSQNTVGGTVTNARNVISGNTRDGIDLGSGGSNQILGNYIGTDITGGHPLGNAKDGIELEISSSNNTIGGGVAAARNVISANGDTHTAADPNTGNGIYMTDGSANNVVQGNYIGLSASGLAADGLGNINDGIYITRTAGGGNTIGGTAAGQGNLIAKNGGYGISIGTTGNTIDWNTVGYDSLDAVQANGKGWKEDPAGDNTWGPNNTHN